MWGNDGVLRTLWCSGQCAALRVLLAIALRVLPYRVWRPLLLRSLRLPEACPRPDGKYRNLIVHCIERTDRWAPAGRCLERSLTAWLLLRRRAPCRVRLCVGWKSPGDPFGHACLEVEGRILFGEPSSSLVLLDTDASERRPA